MASRARCRIGGGRLGAPSPTSCWWTKRAISSSPASSSPRRPTRASRSARAWNASPARRASNSPTSTASCTAPPWWRTPSSNAPAPGWGSSPPAGFVTCSRSAPRCATTSTISSWKRRNRWRRATGALPWTSGSTRAAPCCCRWTRQSCARPRGRWSAWVSRPSRSASSTATSIPCTSDARARSWPRHFPRFPSRSRPWWPPRSGSTSAPAPRPRTHTSCR